MKNEQLLDSKSDHQDAQHLPYRLPIFGQRGSCGSGRCSKAPHLLHGHSLHGPLYT